MPDMYYHVNVYVIEQEYGVVEIDAGVESIAPRLHKLIKNHYNPKLILGVVLTHGHADHSGGGNYFQSKGIDVSTPTLDYPLPYTP